MLSPFVSMVKMPMKKKNRIGKFIFFVVFFFAVIFSRAIKRCSVYNKMVKKSEQSERKFLQNISAGNLHEIAYKAFCFHLESIKSVATFFPFRSVDH